LTILIIMINLFSAIILVSTMIYLTALGISDLKWRSAPMKAFLPLFALGCGAGAYDIVTGNGGAFLSSAVFTVIIWILSMRFSIKVKVASAGNGDVDANITRGVSEGDFYVLAALVWIITGLPLFLVILGSVMLTLLSKNKFIPFVTFLAVAFDAIAVLMLAGLVH